MWASAGMSGVESLQMAQLSVDLRRLQSALNEAAGELEAIVFSLILFDLCLGTCNVVIVFTEA